MSPPPNDTLPDGPSWTGTVDVAQDECDDLTDELERTLAACEDNPAGEGKPSIWRPRFRFRLGGRGSSK